jgi:predicted RNase H-like HicB family nuclease
MTMTDSDAHLWQRAEELAARNYELSISIDTLSTGEKVHVVSNPELPGCLGHGQTLAEAMRELAEARVDYIYYLLVDGLDVPSPHGATTTAAAGGQIILSLQSSAGDKQQDASTNAESIDQTGFEARSTRFLLVEGKFQSSGQ